MYQQGGKQKCKNAHKQQEKAGRNQQPTFYHFFAIFSPLLLVSLTVLFQERHSSRSLGATDCMLFGAWAPFLWGSLCTERSVTVCAVVTTNHLSLSFVLHQYPLTGVIHSTTMELQQVLLAQEPDGADIKPPQIPFCVSNDIENLVFRGGGVKVLYHPSHTKY